MKKLVKPLIFVLSFLLIFVFLVKPTIEKLSFGIDLQGGFEILYEVETLDGSKLTSEDLDNTYKAIVNRIDTLGVSEPVITVEGENLIRIQLPGVSNEEEARERISTTAALTFRDVNDELLMTSEILGKGGASLTQNPQTFSYQVKLDIKDSAKFYDVTKDISKRDNNENIMVIWLDFEEGIDSFASATDCGRGSMKCISAPYVNEGINGEVVIEGGFTKESAQTLVDLINSGALPTKLIEESTPRSVSASFGQDVINKTAIAGIITFALISFILIFKYRISGLLGSICLFIYVMLVFIIFNSLDGVLTLPGIAALILGIGMAVDSIIISIERIKEEVASGKKLGTAIKEGNKLSLGAIIDANITTMIAGVVLYIFGESSVKGFATMLIITIIVTVLITVILFRIFINEFVNSKCFDKKEKLFLGNSKKYKKRSFNKNAKYAVIISSTIISIGLLFVIVKGFNFGVDFTGGTNINISSTEKIDFDKVIKSLEEYEITGYDYYLGSESEGYIKINSILNADEEINIKSSLSDLGIESSMYEISTLVTNTLTENAIRALLYSLVAIIIYVMIRFNFNYALSAVLMLIHDVLIILAVFAIFGIEINFIIVAALLTIIGYSINDTIVVFDRIRENKNKYKKKKFEKNDLDEIVDVSSSQTITRNIWTTITTLIAVVILIMFNLSDILTFNIAIFIGLIAGSVSSLIIGSYLWSILEIRSINKPKDEEDDEVEELKIKGINS